jgi:predicted RNA binding protein YcfA (HicA-like mRNA interferase family)
MSKRLPRTKPKEVLRALGRAGFIVHHTTGSHYVLKHPDKPHLRVTVPYHNKDLQLGTLAAIIAQAGLSVEELVDLL